MHPPARRATRMPPRLVALTPGPSASSLEPAALERAAAQALAAGLPGLLLREPQLADRELLALARALRARCDEHGAWFAVHDRLHVALAARADAVHLGFRSLSPDAARTALERAAASDVALGLSAHAGDEPNAWASVDYVVFGPVRATPKDPPIAPVGCEGLARAVERAGRTPLHAIGGLAPDDAGDVLAAGARGAFVLRGVLGAEHPAAAVRAYLATFGATFGATREGDAGA